MYNKILDSINCEKTGKSTEPRQLKYWFNNPPAV